MLKMKNKLAFILILFIPFVSSAQVKLPKLVSDGMVLQRNTNVKIWGWASNGEKVTVNFLNKVYSTTADSTGDWDIILPKQKAGGPYDMRISGTNSITIHNILIGDVWVCSGQSNMEHNMGSFSWVYPDIIANSANKNIRQFLVPETYNFDSPQSDFSHGKWVSANPKTVLDFTAVGYFFGKYLYDKYKIPIGLINSSLGGSPIESWLSSDALKRFPADLHEADMYKDSTLIKKIEASDNARMHAWYTELWKVDRGNKDPKQMWYDESFNTSGWDSMNVPGYWANETELGPVNGVMWFRRKFKIPSSMTGKPAQIILGRIVDADSVYVNGKFVGTTGYLYPRRRYDIPRNLLREGTNTVVVRVISNAGRGGFVPDKLYAIVAGNDTVDLKGEWNYKLGAEMPTLAGQTFVRWKPLGLYNAMLAPLLNYRIKGVVWYQGESNVWNAGDYFKLFSAMIKDWRNKWDEGVFPFLFVQLPNFMKAKSEPSESGWALLREAQLKALSLPNTGMGVTIDIGEWNDIHPVDKKDVGKRLFLAAEKVAYGNNNIVYSGPIYKSMKIEGSKIILSFTNEGSGLMAKGGGELKRFSIAGSDRHFVWAKAKIEGDKVVVWSEKISNPIAVRYAWSDNPAGANLYNKEGLPASPFRTDNF